MSKKIDPPKSKTITTSSALPINAPKDIYEGLWTPISSSHERPHTSGGHMVGHTILLPAAAAALLSLSLLFAFLILRCRRRDGKKQYFATFAKLSYFLHHISSCKRQFWIDNIILTTTKVITINYLKSAICTERSSSSSE